MDNTSIEVNGIESSILLSMLSSKDVSIRLKAKTFLKIDIPIRVKDILMAMNNVDAFDLQHLEYVKNRCKEYPNPYERVMNVDIPIQLQCGMVSKNDVASLLIGNIENYLYTTKDEVSRKALDKYYETKDPKSLQGLSDYVRSKLLPESFNRFIES